MGDYMRRLYNRRNQIKPWHLTLILILVSLIYMIFTITTNFKTPLNKAEYITNGQQYVTLIKGKDLKTYCATFLGMQDRKSVV